MRYICYEPFICEKSDLAKLTNLSKVFKLTVPEIKIKHSDFKTQDFYLLKWE